MATKKRESVEMVKADLDDNDVELVEAEVYRLDVNIRRPDLMRWLSAIPEENLELEVERTLAVGNQILTFMQASSGQESMERMFSPVLGKMEGLNSKIDLLLGAANGKAQQKGVLGESVVLNQLKAAFPLDTFDLTTTTAEQADIRALLELPNGIKRELRVEVKLYTNAVTTEQVEKFQRDMASTQAKYGLFVSLTSDIAKMAGPFVIDQRADYTAIYVPSAGVDGWGLIRGLTMIRAVMAAQEQSGSRLVFDASRLERAWQRIHEQLQKFEGQAKAVGEVASGLAKARESLNAALDAQILKAKDVESGLRRGLDALHEQLRDEIHGLPSPTPPELPSVIEPAEQAERFQAFTRENPKHAPLVARLLSDFELLGLTFVWTAESSLQLWSGDRCVGSLVKKNASSVTVRIDPAGRPVSHVLGQVPINKENQFEVTIPIKGEMEAPIALALGLLKQVV
jgi:hypothetical protein